MHHHVVADLHISEQNLGLGDAAQPHGRLALADHETLCLVADREKAADTLLLALLIEHARKHQMQLRDAAAGDPVLAAVDDVAAAPAVGARGHLAGGRSRAGLGDADRRLVACEHQLGGELLLGLGAVMHHGRDRAHVGLDHDPPGDAADLRHLVDHQRCFEETEAKAAILLGNGHPEEAGLGQRLHIVPGILLCSVDLGGARRDGLARQRARTLLQLKLGMA